jgi:hypothetical protein
VVAAAGYEASSAELVAEALRVRRDRVGEHYLLGFAPIEAPVYETDRLCFDDLAIARGLHAATSVRYAFVATDLAGHELARGDAAAVDAHTCLPVAPSAPPAYLVVAVSATGAARPTRLHLRWRADERRYVVVGIERMD